MVRMTAWITAMNRTVPLRVIQFRSFDVQMAECVFQWTFSVIWKMTVVTEVMNRIVTNLLVPQINFAVFKVGGVCIGDTDVTRAPTVPMGPTKQGATLPLSPMPPLPR